MPSDEHQELPRNGISPRAPSVAFLPWLEDTGSLTERMRATCGADFRLRFLVQKFARPLVTEARILDLPPRRHALIREVLLCCRETPWIFARSILPFSVLRGSNRRIAHLGKRPLGDILFSSSDLRRGAIKISALKTGAPLHEKCARALGREPEGAWLRQSLFEVHDETLLVNEIFLPEIGTE